MKEAYGGTGPERGWQRERIQGGGLVRYSLTGEVSRLKSPIVLPPHFQTLLQCR